MDVETRPSALDMDLCADTVQALMATQRAISKPLEPHAVMKSIVHEALLLTRADLCLLYLVEHGRLVVAAQDGGAGPRLLGVAAEAGDSALWQALRQRTPQPLNRSTFKRIPGQAGICAPLIWDDQPLGVLVAASNHADGLRPDALALLALLAPGAAQALFNGMRFIRAQRQAVLAERRRAARQVQAVLSGPLFSAFLIADVLPRIYERDPSAGRLRIEELREITGSALEQLKPLTELPSEEG